MTETIEPYTILEEHHDWQQVVALAEHYVAIGATTVHLWRYPAPPLDAYPWASATKLEASPATDSSGACDFKLIAPFPCGVTFTWTIEPLSYEGGAYVPNVPLLADVAARLPAALVPVLRDHLRAISRLFEEGGRAQRTVGNQQIAAAASVFALTGAVPFVRPADEFDYAYPGY